MTETVELTFTAPARMIKAAKHICEAFNIPIGEYLEWAIRGEIQCGYT